MVLANPFSPRCERDRRDRHCKQPEQGRPELVEFAHTPCVGIDTRSGAARRGSENMPACTVQPGRDALDSRRRGAGGTAEATAPYFHRPHAGARRHTRHQRICCRVSPGGGNKGNASDGTPDSSQSARSPPGPDRSYNWRPGTGVVGVRPKASSAPGHADAVPASGRNLPVLARDAPSSTARRCRPRCSLAQHGEQNRATLVHAEQHVIPQLSA